MTEMHKITEKRKELLELLKDNHIGAENYITSAEIEEKLGIKGATVRQIINALRSQGQPYVATRDGVEKIRFKNSNAPATGSQQELIKNLLADYPDSKNSYEYDDYKDNPTIENASEFITETLEQFVYPTSDNEKYLDYIANRPRVEIIDTHGLFNGSNNKIILSQVADEISSHTGNVWTPIISLRREDADSTDYQNASAWKSLIASKVFEIANSLKIHPDNFRWYGAFHNVGVFFEKENINKQAIGTITSNELHTKARLSVFEILHQERSLSKIIVAIKQKIQPLLFRNFILKNSQSIKKNLLYNISDFHLKYIISINKHRRRLLFSDNSTPMHLEKIQLI